MRVVLDTNVLVSAVFFGGIPGRVLGACVEGYATLVLSPAVHGEYRRVGRELGRRYPQRTSVWQSVLAHIAIHAHHVEAAALRLPASEDADDDHFLACALAARPCLIVSGDQHLLKMSGWNDIEVQTPGKFCDLHLRQKDR